MLLQELRDRFSIEKPLHDLDLLLIFREKSIAHYVQSDDGMYLVRRAAVKTSLKNASFSSKDDLRHLTLKGRAEAERDAAENSMQIFLRISDLRIEREVTDKQCFRAVASGHQAVSSVQITT